MAGLDIVNVKPSDKGLYTVKAVNHHGESVATINLNFDDDSNKISDGKAPRFPVKPKICQKDDMIIIECLLEANPAPDIMWYHADQCLENSPRFKMERKGRETKDAYILTLAIIDPKKDDGGYYVCSASNVFGVSNANIALNFDEGICITLPFFSFKIKKENTINIL